MDEKKVQAIMNLIIYGGDGKSSSVEAIQAAKEGNFELADEKIKEQKNHCFRHIIRRQRC